MRDATDVKAPGEPRIDPAASDPKAHPEEVRFLEGPQARGYELRRQIADVVAAGRPPCPLCGAPMDPAGHVCPRSNGHHPR